MKKIFFLLLLFPLPITIHAQMINLKCDFVKDADSTKGITIYGPQVQQGEFLITVSLKGDTTYILLLKYYGQEAPKGKLGFSVVFEDGFKINYPKEEINTFKPQDGSSTFYHTKVRLKRRDAMEYAKQRIKEYVLVNQKVIMPKESGERFRKNLECYLTNY